MPTKTVVEAYNSNWHVRNSPSTYIALRAAMKYFCFEDCFHRNDPSTNVSMVCLIRKQHLDVDWHEKVIFDQQGWPATWCPRTAQGNMGSSPKRLQGESTSSLLSWKLRKSQVAHRVTYIKGKFRTNWNMSSHYCQFGFTRHLFELYRLHYWFFCSMISSFTTIKKSKLD